MSTDLASYLKGMHSQSVTCNWDVAVTYDEAKINALLADRHAQPGSGMTTEVDLRERVEDRLGEYYQNYQLNLGPPLIQFQSTSTFPACSLKTQIASGSIWTSEINDPKTKKNKKELDPNTYWITISNIHLSVLDGRADHVGDGSDTIIFPPNDKSDRHIVVDIPITGEQLDVSVDYPDGYEPPYPMKREILVTALKEFLKRETNAIAYTLASINNHKPSSGTLDLVPQAFRFVTYNAGKGLSFLTILQTKGSSSPGDTKDVQAKWVTKWSDSAKVPPVPSTQSASIIINNSFFFQSFIKPALRSQATSISDVLINDDIGGLALQCKWPKQTRKPNDYDKGYGRPSSRWPVEWRWSELHVPAVEFDPNNGSPLRLTFNHSKGFDKPATLYIHWQYKYKSTWNGKQIKKTWHKPVGDPKGDWYYDDRNREGSFNTTYTLDKTINLTALSDEDLSIEVGPQPSDWSTVAVPDEGDGLWGDDCLVYITQPTYRKCCLRNEMALIGAHFKRSFNTQQWS
ncbi:hypothetical protein PHLCEN_2v1823 [Hermanssonia centrifuga]|uniref:Uncharacterized protein n=1 Tax=Hermanssonia centrifuga TaxID=98765 RepID=A0A2R6RVQ7_9APHY|nr:hypothetical protein PHLCEN_2v13337 [Hermanssonia centrifuga]PSS34113.1 hypothetical protein PHLCEN_2v1823 [Hermanssonia centrifuga]